jgi:membrane protein
MKRSVTAAVRRTRERAPWAPSGVLRAAIALRNVAIETYHGFRADRGLDLAGSLSFATLLLSVPLLATFSLLLAAFFRENVGGIVDLAGRVLPFQAERLSESLREFISESTTISGIGLAVLILSSIRMIFLVEGVFNAVWGAPRRRAWLQRVAIYALVLLAGSLLVGAIGLGVRRLHGSAVGGALLGSPEAEHAFRFALQWVALTLLYRFLPNAAVDWSAAALGGGIISIALEGLRAFFALYVQALSSMNLVTGSLALILLSLFSVYLLWVLILLGVELTRAIQVHAGRALEPGTVRAGRAENALRMLLRMSRSEATRFRDLYDEQEANAGIAEELLQCLAARGLVDGEPGSGYRLTRKPSRIRIAEVVEAVSPNLYAVSPLEEDPVARFLEPMFARLDRERRTLLSATLADLADRAKA